MIKNAKVKNKEKELMNKKVKNNNINNLFRNNKKIEEYDIENENYFNKNLQNKNNLLKYNKLLTKIHKKLTNLDAKRKINIAFIFKILLIIISFQLTKSNLRQLNIKNEISLIIRGTGIYQNILGGIKYTPNEVIINEEKMERISSSYELTQPENRVILRYNTSLKACNNMFFSIEELLSIDLSNFDSSQITDASSMFYGCKNLKSINFHNFNTSSVRSMEYMFSGCKALNSLDLSSFDTSLVTSMRSMLNDCSSLVSLNLSNFNTNSLEYMDEMFQNAESLLSLDLSNFNTSSLKSLQFTFYGCKSLIFINFISFEENNYIGLNGIFSNNLINNLTYCIDQEKSSNIYNRIKIISSNNDCNNTCFSKKAKIIKEKKICIDDCRNDDTYIYEYNNICYNYTIEESENTDINENTVENIKFNSQYIDIKESTVKQVKTEIKDENIIIEITENIQIIESITEKNEKTEIIDENKISKIAENTKNVEISEKFESSNNVKTEKINFSEKLIQTEKINIVQETNDNKKNEESEINIQTMEENRDNLDLTKLFEFFSSEVYIINNEDSIKKDQIIKNIKKELINGNLNNLLINVTSGEKKDLIAIDNNTIYQITTSENQKSNKYTNISTINLGYCENKLKEIYGINQNLSLLILKIDYYEPGLLIPVIGYEVFDPINKSQLDLNYCKDILVKLNIPVSINENKEFKHDPNSDYYNDECYAYTTENGTDILLEDRKNEYINNNLSLCEYNCTYKGYNKDTKKALCECESKIKIALISEIMNNKNILSNNFSNDNAISNIISTKCTKTLFTKDGLIENIGNYILVFTFLFFMISAIIFYKCGYQIIEDNIQEILNSKKKNKVNIFGKRQKMKLLGKKKTKKASKISNPKIRKTIKKSISKNEEPKKNSCLSTTKLYLRNNNIFINIGNNKKKRSAFLNGINIFRIDKSSKKIEYNDCELNSFNFKKALIYDKRTFFQYYFSLLNYNNLILFAFYPVNDYNIRIIKISIFLLSFNIYFLMNTLFYGNSSIHKVYEDGGSYNFSFFIPQIIDSFIISYYIIVIIKYFSLSERQLLDLKYEENITLVNEKEEKIKRCLIIKYFSFYALSFIFISLFWYYLSLFCAVYKNSQLYVIKNTFVSLSISLLYPAFYNFIPGVIRIISLNNNNSVNECFYKLNKLMQIL